MPFVLKNNEEVKSRALWEDQKNLAHQPVLVDRPQWLINPIKAKGRFQCDVKINGSKESVVKLKHKGGYWNGKPQEAIMKVCNAEPVSSFEISFLTE